MHIHACIIFALVLKIVWMIIFWDRLASKKGTSCIAKDDLLLPLLPECQDWVNTPHFMCHWGLNPRCHAHKVLSVPADLEHQISLCFVQNYWGSITQENQTFARSDVTCSNQNCSANLYEMLIKSTFVLFNFYILFNNKLIKSHKSPLHFPYCLHMWIKFHYILLFYTHIIM